MLNADSRGLARAPGTPGVAAAALPPAVAVTGEIRRKPHVCFVAPEAWPVFAGDQRTEFIGGAEVQQSILARLLARAGYPVSMICFDYGQPPRVELDGVTVLRAHARDEGIPVLRFLHPRITRFWRLMREVDADIYYQRSAAMLTALMAAFCRRHGKRSIYAGASDTDFLPGQQLIRFRRDRWLFERGLGAVDAVIVQNEAQARDCSGYYGRRATLIPSCYELPAGALPARGDYVLWAATLRPSKRPELLLELARLLPHRRFVMIGGADRGAAKGSAYFDAIRAGAAALPNLEFTGFLPLAKAEPWFDGARVVISTSRAEGMPNVFLQAWARGVPTLAFVDTGAHHAGQPVSRLVAQTTEAASEIERLFADDEYYARTATRCREYFDLTHGPAGVLGRYQRLFEDLMRTSGGKP